MNKIHTKPTGVTGNRGLYGFADTGEYLAKLDGVANREVYEKMIRSDSQIKSTLQGIGLPIRQADWYMEPPTDKPDDKEITDFLSMNLFEKMSMTWDDTLRHIEIMYRAGFMPMEKLYYYSEKYKRVMLRKLDPRMPVSIVEWEFDKKKGGLVGPVQADEDGNRTTLPIENLLIFTTEREGDNWEGTSLLRAMYMPWYIKQRLIKIDAIKHDRYGAGIPVMKVPSSVKNGSDEWADVETLLQEIHACENSGVVEPEGYELRILVPDGDGGTDIMPSIKNCDYYISRAGLQMFTNLGQDKAGSYALSETFLDVFLHAEQAFADYIAGVINRFLIPEWVDYNWKVKEYPQLKVRQIKKLNNTTIAELKNAGLITSDIEIEQAIRRNVELPEMDDEAIKRREEQLKQPPPVNEPQKQVPVDEKTKKSTPEEEHSYANIKRDRSALTGKEITTEEEMIPDLVAMETTLDNNSDDLEATLFTIKQKQVDDLVNQILGGRKVQNLRVILKKEMYAASLRKYKEMVKEGRRQVREELKTQGMKLADVTREDLKGFTDDELSILVEKAAGVLTTDLMMHATEMRKANPNITRDELETSLRDRAEGVSKLHWSSIAVTAVNGGWGDGRRTEALDLKDEIEYEYYSAILDGNLCPACEATYNTPGAERHEVGDPTFTAPNPQCYSTRSTGQGNFCRCFNIYVFNEETQVEVPEI